MSVLIKGMKMPKYCMECKFCGCGSINEFEYWCGLTGSCLGAIGDIELWEDMMAADCPLIEVPTSHGRLVDADEFRKVVDGLPSCYNGFSDAYDKSYIIGLIDEMPTIIKAEEG